MSNPSTKSLIDKSFSCHLIGSSCELRHCQPRKRPAASRAFSHQAPLQKHHTFRIVNIAFGDGKEPFAARTNAEREVDEYDTCNSESESGTGTNTFRDTHRFSQTPAHVHRLTPAVATDYRPAYELTLKASSLSPRDASHDPYTSCGTVDKDKYAFFSTFDAILVIGDSGFMASSSWEKVRAPLSAFAPICTSLRARGGYYHIRDTRQIDKLFDFVQPLGSIPTGFARLHSIPTPYVSHLSRDAGDLKSTKPVNIIITDGSPGGDPESIIAHHAGELDKIKAIPHQDLKELDEGITERGVRDMEGHNQDRACGSNGNHNETSDETDSGYHTAKPCPPHQIQHSQHRLRVKIFSGPAWKPRQRSMSHGWKPLPIFLTPSRSCIVGTAAIVASRFGRDRGDLIPRGSSNGAMTVRQLYIMCPAFHPVVYQLKANPSR
ncbi:hypothetical protein FHETE_10353 [Fusarium heterosporum]|uniref:Uncharacterized protein n=1 Tax=Fusarium heterosporum TaxID=42747 RepID=A0A8H5SPQ8_FUSHE|nr:hypothetical protein FHETE_10353 [Fusarium heterosporum]